MLKQLAYNLLGENYTRMAYTYRDWQTKRYAHRHPYHYDPKRYEGTFLTCDADYPYDDSQMGPLDRVIYIFWTGDNEITPNRLRGIQTLEKVSQVKVQLITPKNLPEYIVADDPLPKAYQYLSFVHRADFLRAYFMYHYGGGYADIKDYFHSWIPAFEKLDSSNNAYVLGYPEVGFEGAAFQEITNEELIKDIQNYWCLLIGNGAYICRPHSRFTAEWYSESRRRLISLSQALSKHPAQDPRGNNPDYPIRWSYMLGAIFHPLCLKYNDHLLKDKALMPSFENYR